MTALEIADLLGIPAIEDDLQPYDLYTAEEAFFTEHAILHPARRQRVDNRQIGDEVPVTGDQSALGGVERESRPGHR